MNIKDKPVKKKEKFFVNKKSRSFVFSAIHTLINNLNKNLIFLTTMLGIERVQFLKILKFVYKIKRFIGLDFLKILTHMDVGFGSSFVLNELLNKHNIFFRKLLRYRIVIRRIRNRIKKLGKRKSNLIKSKRNKLIRNFVSYKSKINILRFKISGNKRTIAFMKVLNSIRSIRAGHYIDIEKEHLNLVKIVKSLARIKFHKHLTGSHFLFMIMYLHDIKSRYSNSIDFIKLNKSMACISSLYKYLYFKKSNFYLRCMKRLTTKQLYKRFFGINNDAFRDRLLGILNDKKLNKYINRLRDKHFLNAINDKNISKHKRLKYKKRLNRSKKYIINFLKLLKGKKRIRFLSYLGGTKRKRKVNRTDFYMFIKLMFLNPFTLWIKKSIINKYNQLTTSNKIRHPKQNSEYLLN